MLAVAEKWLREILGNEAVFHDGQWEAIEALAVKRQRVLVVQRTGWGKSLVYFLATRLLRDQGYGPTVLVSPLLSLMRNQIQSAERWGLNAASINSSNYDDHATIEAKLLAGKIDLLLISPERLANDRFQKVVWSQIRQTIGMLVIDEAHCISDWGHDFRPDYRRLMHILKDLRQGTPVLGTTATASNRVVEDVSEILGAGLNILRGTLTRESLRLYVYSEPMDAAERLTLLSYLLSKIEGSGIIYCTTTRDCVTVARWLQTEGFNVKPYYAQVEEEIGENRVQQEEQLLNNELKALVASVALGMGFDKPDLHYVLHYQQPGNIIGYYQQIGRAGRGIDNAHIVLMHGAGDDDIQQHFIETAFPRFEHVEAAIQAFHDHDALTTKDLQAYVNVRQSTLEKIITHLEVETIIERTDGGYALLPTDRRPDYERWGRITAQRYAELEQMHQYIAHRDCLMHFIAAALDDPTVLQPCGRCKNCRASQSKFQPDAAKIERARAFLRQSEVILLEPRKQWVKGAVGKTRVKMDDLNETGVALSNYYASGWGEQVRRGREHTQHFGDELVEASVQMLQTYWQKTGIRPLWVTNVPSLRRPNLVSDFTMRLANALKLPYHPVIQHVQQHRPQVEMLNSHQQVTNVWNAFAITPKVPTTSVLLVDDLVNSKWTLTVVGDILRRQGSGAVYPFVLADMGG